MVNRRTKILIQKYSLYGFILFVLYLLQNTPGLFAIGQIKPVLVLPFIVCIAMLEGELVGGLLGVAAGLLCDCGSSLIFGVNSLIFMVACVAVGLLVIYYMQPSLINSLLFTGALGLARQLFEYFFYYLMWGYPNASLVLVKGMLPTVLYTLAVTPLFFWGVQKLYGWYKHRLDP